LASGAPVDIALAKPAVSQLKRDLHKALLRKRIAALALIAPLAIFLLVTFVVPIAVLLTRAIANPEIASTLPHTVAALAGWDRKSVPPERAFAALADDLAKAKADNTTGTLARRINAELPGARSVRLKTA